MAEGDRGSGRNGSVRRLVIVESPTKARKIASYLGSNYIVESSRGHIRDLPRNAADVSDPAVSGGISRRCRPRAAERDDVREVAWLVDSRVSCF